MVAEMNTYGRLALREGGGKERSYAELWRGQIGEAGRHPGGCTRRSATEARP